MYDLKLLEGIPPYDWPLEAREQIPKTLTAKSASLEDRVLAAELAGDYVVCDDQMMKIIVGIALDPKQPEVLRARCASSTGVGLQVASENDGWDDSFLGLDTGEDEISAQTGVMMRTAMKTLIDTRDTPKLVKRRALEASVRFPEDWHKDFVGEMYATDDPDWKLTAVFAMGFVRGFDNEILDALNSTDPMILHHAVAAAATWEVKSAWVKVKKILKNVNLPKELRIAAIEGAATYGTKSLPTLEQIAQFDDDDDIRNAAAEAMEAAEDEYGMFDELDGFF